MSMKDNTNFTTTSNSELDEVKLNHVEDEGSFNEDIDDVDDDYAEKYNEY